MRLNCRRWLGYSLNRFNIKDTENEAGHVEKLTYPVNTFYNNYVLLWYLSPKFAIDAGLGWSINFAGHYPTYRLPASSGSDYYSFGQLDFADITPFSVLGMRFGKGRWQFALRHEFLFVSKAISGTSTLSGTALGNNNMQRLTLNVQLKFKQ